MTEREGGFWSGFGRSRGDLEGFIGRVKQWLKEREDSSFALVEAEVTEAVGIVAMAAEDLEEMKKKRGCP